MSTSNPRIVNNSKGGAKLWIMIFLVLLVAIGLGMGAVLPHYQAKWRLQDKMRIMLTDYVDYKDDNPYGNVEIVMERDLKKYVDKHKLGFDPTQTHPKDLCQMQAKLREKGKFECKYTAKVTLFGYHLYDMQMHAIVKMEHVPVE